MGSAKTYFHILFNKLQGWTWKHKQVYDDDLFIFDSHSALAIKPMLCNQY
jgi:hypothetical protein